MIGINDYQYPYSKLTTPVNDASSVGKLLHEKYNFEVTYLLDADATYERIWNKLYQFAKKPTQNNLLIYFAGHGEFNESKTEARWVPIDAKEGNPYRLKSSDLTNLLEIMNYMHILVVADSCFVGALTKGISVEPGQSEARRISAIKGQVFNASRTALVSGGMAPQVVPGGRDHSIFAETFLKVLTNNNGPMDGDRLKEEIRKQVASRTKSVPEYQQIPNTGHRGGEFFFIPKTYAASAPPEYAYVQSQEQRASLGWFLGRDRGA